LSFLKTGEIGKFLVGYLQQWEQVDVRRGIVNENSRSGVDTKEHEISQKQNNNGERQKRAKLTTFSF